MSLKVISDYLIYHIFYKDINKKIIKRLKQYMSKLISFEYFLKKSIKY